MAERPSEPMRRRHSAVCACRRAASQPSGPRACCSGAAAAAASAVQGSAAPTTPGKLLPSGAGSCGICRWRQAAAVQRVVPSGSWSRTALQARALGVWARSRAAASCTARRTEGRHGLLALARGERRGAESPGWPKCRGIGAALAAREGEARGAGRQTCGSAAMLPPAPRSCLRPSNPQPTLLLTVVEGKLRAWLGIYCTVEGPGRQLCDPTQLQRGNAPQLIISVSEEGAQPNGAQLLLRHDPPVRPILLLQTGGDGQAREG